MLVGRGVPIRFVCLWGEVCLWGGVLVQRCVGRCACGELGLWGKRACGEVCLWGGGPVGRCVGEVPVGRCGGGACGEVIVFTSFPPNRTTTAYFVENSTATRNYVSAVTAASYYYNNYTYVGYCICR